MAIRAPDGANKWVAELEKLSVKFLYYLHFERDLELEI